MYHFVNIPGFKENQFLLSLIPKPLKCQPGKCHLYFLLQRQNLGYTILRELIKISTLEMVVFNYDFLMDLCLCSCWGFNLEPHSIQMSWLLCVVCSCVWISMNSRTSHRSVYLGLLPHYQQTDVSPAVFCTHLLFFIPSICHLCITGSVQNYWVKFLHMYINVANHPANLGLLYTLKQFR